MAEDGPKIVITAQDKTKAGFDSAKKGLEDLKKSTAAYGKEQETATAAGVKGMLQLGAAAAAVGSTIKIISELSEAAREAAQFERMSTAAQDLAHSYGQSMDDILEATRKASLGTVSDYDLMASANKALMLGVGQSAEDMAKLMEVAAVRGRAMGLSTTQAFNDIVTGIGRKSKLILDNLGIVLDLNDVYSDYAETLGKTSDQLTDNEQKQAMLNAVLDDTADYLKTTGGLLEDNASKWEQLDAQTQNYFTALKMNISQSGAGIAGLFANMFGGATERMMLGVELQERMKFLNEEQSKQAEALLRGGSVEQLQKFLDNLDWSASMGGANQFATSLNNVEEAASGVSNELGNMSEILSSSKDALLDAGIGAGQTEQALNMLNKELGLVGASSEDAAKFNDIMAESLKQGTIDTANWAASMAEFIGQVEMGVGVTEALKGLLDSLPRSIRTRIMVEVFGYEQVKGLSILGTTSADYTPRAAGGPVAPAPYWVGEAGPELFVPSVNGRVLSNSDSKAALKGGGGASVVNVIINTPVNMADKAFVERELAPYILEAMRRVS